MAEMRQNQHCGCLDYSSTGYCQPRHLPAPETTIQAFLIAMKPPLSFELIDRLEINSKVLWQSAGGVNYLMCNLVHFSNIGSQLNFQCGICVSVQV